MLRIVALTTVIVLVCSVLLGAGIWLDVPFITQERKGCGAAVIAMVMSYWTERGFPIEA